MTGEGLITRNIRVNKKRTSVRLEPEMWQALDEICSKEECTIHDIADLVSLKKRETTSLTSGLRIFIMLYYRAATSEEAHIMAGHGNFSKMLERARELDTNSEEKVA